MLDQSSSNRKKYIENVKELIKSYGFECHEAKLSLSTKFDDEERIANFFKLVHSQTSREDLLAKIRLRTLINVARKFKCSKIFTSENQESLAIQLLSKIALGMSEPFSPQVVCSKKLICKSIIKIFRDF